MFCATSVCVVSPSGCCSGTGEEAASGVLPNIADCLRFREATVTGGDGSGVFEVWVAFPGNNRVLGPGEFGGGLESERANMMAVEGEVGNLTLIIVPIECPASISSAISVCSALALNNDCSTVCTLQSPAPRNLLTFF